jgi:hypothetical protein
VQKRQDTEANQRSAAKGTDELEPTAHALLRSFFFCWLSCSDCACASACAIAKAMSAWLSFFRSGGSLRTARTDIRRSEYLPPFRFRDFDAIGYPSFLIDREIVLR